jgi:hypothetical protein
MNTRTNVLLADNFSGLWQRFGPCHVVTQNMLLGVVLGGTEEQPAQRHKQGVKPGH